MACQCGIWRLRSEQDVLLKSKDLHLTALAAGGRLEFRIFDDQTLVWCSHFLDKSICVLVIAFHPYWDEHAEIDQRLDHLIVVGSKGRTFHGSV